MRTKAKIIEDNGDITVETDTDETGNLIAIRQNQDVVFIEPENLPKLWRTLQRAVKVPA